MSAAWLEKLRSKIAPPDKNGCMKWLAFRRPDGYGVAGLGNGRGQTTAHRAVYLLAVGDIPEGLECDHLCRVRDCVNPEHIELVTHAENVRRGLRGALNPYREVCKYGHGMADAYVVAGKPPKRQCRVCQLARANARWARIRAARVVSPDGEAVTP